MHGKHAVPAVTTGALAAAAVVAGAVPALASVATPPAGGTGEPPAVPNDSPVIALDVAHARPLVTRIVHVRTDTVYTVVSGDTLSGIAGSHCGTASRWPAVYNGNKKVIGADPDVILPGQRLAMTCDGPAVLASEPAVQAAAQLSPTAAVEARRDPFDGHHGNCGDGDGDGMDASCAVIFPGSQSGGESEQAPSQASSQATAQVTGASGTYHGSSSFQQCVIARESGGDSQVMNSSGHYGLYQFSASTWQAYGGSAATFGHASVAEQNAVFNAAMATPGGASNWSPYDGC